MDIMSKFLLPFPFLLSFRRREPSSGEKDGFKKASVRPDMYAYIPGEQRLFLKAAATRGGFLLLF